LVDEEHAIESARAELREIALRGDPRFAAWDTASPGQPVLVRDVFRQPSYWVVPVLLRGRVRGFIRVLGTGRVAAYGAYARDPGRPADGPATVTGIDAEEAARRVRGRVRADRGETASEPVYVHDGPPGREAWLVEVARAGRPDRWLFVTAAGTYERPAGQPRDGGRE
jgi:hypothetical protein